MAISIWDMRISPCFAVILISSERLPVQTWTPLGSRIIHQIKTEEELEYLARAEEIGGQSILQNF